MKIVIDIDENIYTRLFDNGSIDAIDMLKACVAIRKGTPLPKNHGRLIDAEEFLRELGSYHIGGIDAIKKYNGENTWEDGLHTAWRVIDDAETIIETESENNE